LVPDCRVSGHIYWYQTVECSWHMYWYLTVVSWHICWYLTVECSWHMYWYLTVVSWHIYWYLTVVSWHVYWYLTVEHHGTYIGTWLWSVMAHILVPDSRVSWHVIELFCNNKHHSNQMTFCLSELPYVVRSCIWYSMAAARLFSE
jgi:hypothetical protein